MFHSEWLKWLLFILLSLLEGNFIHHQTGLESQPASDCLINRYSLPVETSTYEHSTPPQATISCSSDRNQNQCRVFASYLCYGTTCPELEHQATDILPAALLNLLPLSTYLLDLQPLPMTIIRIEKYLMRFWRTWGTNVFSASFRVSGKGDCFRVSTIESVPGE